MTYSSKYTRRLRENLPEPNTATITIAGQEYGQFTT